MAELNDISPQREITFKTPDGRDITWIVKRPSTKTEGLFSEWSEQQAIRAAEKFAGGPAYDVAIAKVHANIEMQLYNWGQSECGKHLDYTPNGQISLGQREYCRLALAQMTPEGTLQNPGFNNNDFKALWETLEPTEQSDGVIRPTAVKRMELLRYVLIDMYARTPPTAPPQTSDPVGQKVA